jgi:hypothetical protein
MTDHHPKSGNGITLPWLNAMLPAQASTSNATPAITGYRCESVGETAGFLGDIVRVYLEWHAPDQGPGSIIAKFPTLRPANLATGKGLLAYERELKFYDAFSTQCPLQPPRFYGGVDVTGQGDYLILIEDLMGARFVSQLDGLSIADAALTVRGLASMHAQYWNDPKLDEPDALYQFSDWAPIYEPSIASGWPLFEGDFSDLIPEAMHPMFAPGNQMAGPIFHYFSQNRPKTLLHGDARMENICFDPVTGKPRMYDWQLAAAGPGVYDLMYFFANSIEPAELFDVGPGLINDYHAALVAGGVNDYAMTDLMQDLQLSACLLFGFASMVGNFLAGGGETERSIVAATTPRYWGVCQLLNVGEIIHDLPARLST